MATYPTTLPRPIARGYGLTPVDPAIRTDMDVGAPRVRRRTAARNDRVKVAWLFTDAQMATFRTWFDDPAEADGGASWFSISLPIGTGGTVALEARFTKVFEATRNAGLSWNVTAELEVRDA